MKSFLKFIRETRGLSVDALAEMVDTSRQQIYRLESGQRQMTREWAVKLASVLDTDPAMILFGDTDQYAKERAELRSSSLGSDMIAARIVGEVSAGVWLEPDEVFNENEEEFIPIGPDPRFPGAAYYSLRVRGNSINRIAVDGEFLICIDVRSSRATPNNGDLVIVQRSRHQGSLIETTAKVLRRAKDGGQELWPASTDPRYQEPVTLTDTGTEEAEVQIIGIAIAKHTRFFPHQPFLHPVD